MALCRQTQGPLLRYVPFPSLDLRDSLAGAIRPAGMKPTGLRESPAPFPGEKELRRGGVTQVFWT